LWQFLMLGLALGLVGASFSVGTPYVARFFPANRRGFAMGFFGAGTRRRRAQHVRGARDHEHLWLAGRAARLCRGTLGDRRHLLVAVSPGSRSG